MGKPILDFFISYLSALYFNNLVEETFAAKNKLDTAKSGMPVLYLSFCKAAREQNVAKLDKFVARVAESYNNTCQEALSARDFTIALALAILPKSYRGDVEFSDARVVVERLVAASMNEGYALIKSEATEIISLHLSSAKDRDVKLRAMVSVFRVGMGKCINGLRATIDANLHDKKHDDVKQYSEKHVEALREEMKKVLKENVTLRLHVTKLEAALVDARSVEVRSRPSMSSSARIPAVASSDTFGADHEGSNHGETENHEINFDSYDTMLDDLRIS